jgi:hypothetical protein
MSPEDKPIVAFVLSLIGGIFILVGGGMMSIMGPFGFGGMMNVYSGYGGYGLVEMAAEVSHPRAKICGG